MKPYQCLFLLLGLMAAAAFWGSLGTRRERPSPVEIRSGPVAVAADLPPPGLPTGIKVTEEPPLARVESRTAGTVLPARFEAPAEPRNLPEIQPARAAGPVTPLPAGRPKAPLPRAKALAPLNGAFTARAGPLAITLPPEVLAQLGQAGQPLLVSPGPDKCLWITNQAHLDRLSERLESSPAPETDIRAFRRLYFAQVERARPGSDGSLAVSSRLLEFAGLAGDCVVVGIDDHFEVWDQGLWREYARGPKAARNDNNPEE